ncbi:hypothetical protein Ddye_023911 [Dipteronia dyeriana]|uniref:Uncharacterized protein n=1 Tax=Dipteronia dyeriana TaxID=168575 RepID=A0AAD9TUG1_9ROSI|nr:hypothetical protein Ddye_023911 [Dipteronia dyeriana]
MIKSGRLSHANKGIGDCFARTVQITMMDPFRSNSAFCSKKENDGLEEWFARNFAKMALFGGTSILLVYHLEYA